MAFLAVIDTNVIISALIKRRTNLKENIKTGPSLILDYIRDGTLVPYISSEILIEYVDVLTRDEFDITDRELIEILDLLLERSQLIKDIESNIELTDKSDVKFYAVTLSARKNDDAYLVTGNKRHFPAEPFVVSPREMVEIIESQSK